MFYVGLFALQATMLMALLGAAWLQVVDLQSAADFIIYGGGAALVVGAMLSWYGEKWAWYQRLEPRAKDLLMKLLAALFAIVVWAIMTYTPPEVLAYLDPIFKVVLVSIGGAAVSQGAHAVRKVLKKPT